MRSHISTAGVVTVFDAPKALCAHVEWAINSVLGTPQRYRWKKMSSSPERFGMTLSWDAAPGVGSQLATTLIGWSVLRFEVTEDPCAGMLGLHVMRTPELGLYRGSVDGLGNLVLNEHQIEGLWRDNQHGDSHPRMAFDRALGRPWDTELESWRATLRADNVRLLERVG